MKQKSSAAFESNAISFIAGVVVTLLVLWAGNAASRGQLIQSFFGSTSSTVIEYEQVNQGPNQLYFDYFDEFSEHIEDEDTENH